MPKAVLNRSREWPFARPVAGLDGRGLPPAATLRAGFRVTNIASAAVLASLLLSGAEAPAADPQSQQIERAQVLRELDEADMPRAVLPPASIDVEQLEQDQIEAQARARDRRWRNLLGAQRRDIHSEDPAKINPRLRKAQAQRQQQADELLRQIQRDALEYRFQRRP